MRRLGLTSLVIALGALAVTLPSAVRADNPMLIGTVGPGFAISLTGPSGSIVTHLDPGTYTIVVHDRATIHNFHLFGPGVDMATDVEGIGDFTWTVTFTDGTYTYRCDPHLTDLIGRFTVGNVPLPPPPPPPPPPSPGPPTRLPPKLLAKVGPGATISLTTTAGTRVKGLLSGRYDLVVRDLSSRDNFHLTGPGLDRKTGIPARTSTTWKVTLKPGLHRYRSDAHAGLKGSFLVKPRPQPATDGG